MDDNTERTRQFLIKQVFDKSWHKLDFGIFKDKLVLRVDCEHIGTEKLKPHGPIKVDGDLSIAKMSNSKVTVPVSLTNFDIYDHQ